MIEKKDIIEIKKLLKSPLNIVITTHMNPDGDAIGSSLALLGILKKLNHNVTVVIPDEIPDFLRWMPCADSVVIHSEKPEISKEIFEKAEIIFCLDFNSIKRLNGLADIVQKNDCVKILIDHHLYPDDFCNYVFSKTNISSTAELLYGFIDNAEWLDLIDKDIATCLFAGIVSDTGCFSYSANSQKTYVIVSKLIDHGIDCKYINTQIYSTFSADRLRLLGFCLHEGLVILPEYKTSYIRLSKENMDAYNFKTGDTEGIVNYPLSIKDIVFTALFMERDNQVKISFRSKGDFDVNKFAKNNFNGGGHFNASGAESELSLDETIRKFTESLQQYKSELNKTIL